jgi:hypothetical protein
MTNNPPEDDGIVRHCFTELAFADESGIPTDPAAFFAV